MSFSLDVIFIDFLPLGNGNVLNCVGIVHQPPFQFRFTMKVTVTSRVSRQFWLWFQPDQVNVWFLHHPPAANVQRIRTDMNIAGIRSNTSICSSETVINLSQF